MSLSLRPSHSQHSSISSNASAKQQQQQSQQIQQQKLSGSKGGEEKESAKIDDDDVRNTRICSSTCSSLHDVDSQLTLTFALCALPSQDDDDEDPNVLQRARMQRNLSLNIAQRQRAAAEHASQLSALPTLPPIPAATPAAAHASSSSASRRASQVPQTVRDVLDDDFGRDDEGGGTNDPSQQPQQSDFDEEEDRDVAAMERGAVRMRAAAATGGGSGHDDSADESSSPLARRAIRDRDRARERQSTRHHSGSHHVTLAPDALIGSEDEEGMEHEERWALEAARQKQRMETLAAAMALVSPQLASSASAANPSGSFIALHNGGGGIPRSRLSEAQQEAYVRKSFPMLAGNSGGGGLGVSPYSHMMLPSSSVASLSGNEGGVLTLGGVGSNKEPRTSPHIIRLTAKEERNGRKPGAAVQQHTRQQSQHGAGEDVLPLYMSKGPLDPLSAASGSQLMPQPAVGGGSNGALHFPALSARALASGNSGMDHSYSSHSASQSSMQATMDALGLAPDLGSSALQPNGASSSRAKALRRIAGMEKAKLAIAVAEQEQLVRNPRAMRLMQEAERNAAVAATTGAATERKPASKRRKPAAAKPSGSSIARSASTNNTTTATGGSAEGSEAGEGEEDRGARMAAFWSQSTNGGGRGGRSAAHGSGGDEEDEPEEKTFLTAMSPFVLPAELASSTVGAAWVGATHGPGAAGVGSVSAEINTAGLWAGPRGKHVRMFARLVESQQTISRWHAHLSGMARALFAAKCRDQGLAPPASHSVIATGAGGSLHGRREARWLGSFLRLVREGLLCLPENGLSAEATPEVCRLLQTRLVPESLLTSQLPRHFNQLDLTSNHLGDDGAAMLARALEAAPTLEVVSVASNRLSGIGIARLCAALSVSTALTSLDLSSSATSSGGSKAGNYIGPGLTGAHSIRLLLERNKSLRSLSLVNVGLGLVSGSLAEVCVGLAASRTLTSLNLGQNGLAENDAPILCAALASGAVSLTTLLLKRNAFGSVGFARFARLLHDVHTLTRLDLSRNEAGLSGWLLLSHALQPNLLMDRLTLDWNDFGAAPGGSQSLVVERRGKSTEEMLSLLSAEVRAAHLKDRFVSPRLGLNYSLRSLSLQHCHLRDKFAAQLLSTLTKHRCLTSLSLAHNELRGGSGVGSGPGGSAVGSGSGALGESLGKFLSSKSSCLTHLDLSHNELNDDVGLAITRALHSNHASPLATLHAQHNDLGEDSAEQLLRLLNAQRSLTCLNLDSNKIPYRLWRMIVEREAKARRGWEEGSLRRLQEQVRELSQTEAQLSQCLADVAFLTQTDAEESLRLSALESDQLNWMSQEQSSSLALKLQADALMDEARRLSLEEFSVEVELRKRKAEQENLMQSMRKTIDQHKSDRVAAEKAAVKCKQDTAAAIRAGKDAFGELDQKYAEKSAQIKHVLRLKDDTERSLSSLAEWIKALQSKVARGDTSNAHTKDGASAAAAAAAAGDSPPASAGGMKRRPSFSQRRPSAASSLLLPRSAAEVAAAATAAASAAAAASLSRLSTLDESAQPLGSPRAARRTRPSVSGGSISTLLRPTAPPTDAMIWSAPVTAPSAGSAASGNKKRGKRGKSNKAKGASAPKAGSKGAGAASIDVPTLFVPSSSPLSPAAADKADTKTQRPSIYNTHAAAASNTKGDAHGDDANATAAAASPNHPAVSATTTVVSNA